MIREKKKTSAIGALINRRNPGHLENTVGGGFKGKTLVRHKKEFGSRETGICLGGVEECGVGDQPRPGQVATENVRATKDVVNLWQEERRVRT